MTSAQTQRNFRDNNLKVTKALPAANASNTSDAIDLGHAQPALALTNAEIVILLPATPSLADTKVVTLTLHDSADGASFAAVTGLATVTATGAGGAGAAAVIRRIKAPSGIRRYIRLAQAVEASGGDNTAISTTLELRF